MSVKFGVVGTAHWGANVHVPGLLKTPGVELVGIHGRSPEKAEEIAQRHGIRAFARYEDMLEAVDAVSIVIPPQAQPSYAIAAADAGKHLLLEKPVAVTLADAAAIAASVERRGVAALVFFVRRFAPGIREAIAAYRDSPWEQALVSVHSAPMTTDSPFRGSLWRQQDGAALWDIGPHALSVLVAMMGPVVEAWSMPAEPRFARFETRHAAGGTAEISLTIHAPPGETRSEYRFSRKGEDVVLPEPVFSRPDALSRAAEELLDLVRSGRRDHECGIGLGVETVRWLAAIENGS